MFWKVKAAFSRSSLKKRPVLRVVLAQRLELEDQRQVLQTEIFEDVEEIAPTNFSSEIL
jgi:hypothetical protein